MRVTIRDDRQAPIAVVSRLFSRYARIRAVSIPQAAASMEEVT